MPLWDKSGTRPRYLDTANSRHCIATSQGWVRRESYTDVHGNVRQKDEVLVHIGGLDTESTMGQPSIAEIYVANSSGGSTIKNGLSNDLGVVFDEPINPVEAAGFDIAVSNTAAGNAVTAFGASTQTPINANNTLVFTFTPGAVGTYKIESQSITKNGTANILSLNTDGEIANVAISDAVSNALSTFEVV